MDKMRPINHQSKSVVFFFPLHSLCLLIISASPVSHTKKNHTTKMHFDLKYVKQLNCELIYLLKYFVVNFECFCLSMVFVVQHRTVCAPLHGFFFIKSLVFNSIWSLFNIFIAISFFSLIVSLVVASVDLLGAVTLSEPLIDGVHLIWQSIGLVH